MTKLYKLAAAHAAYFSNYYRYKMVFWDKFDYSILSRNIMYYRKKGKFQKGTWNDIIISADTETSKSHEIGDNTNHVCAWTISMRAYHVNICTIYGTRPSEMMEAFKKIREALPGDDFFVYWHNMAYDWVFLRLFVYANFGTPVKELNTKPHYPVCLKFKNGMIFKDSLILAQCKLEKWANDLNVHHKKAVGSWEYDEIRDQTDKPSFSRAELRYIENDTLALVECIDALCISLNKQVAYLPYTATGIIREELREIGKKHDAHKEFLRTALSFEQNEIFQLMFHGGFCHSNRFFIGDILDEAETKGADFNSSYPFCMLCFRYPAEKFIELDKKVGEDYIIRNSEDYAFIFRASFRNIRLKDKLFPMPALQASKCDHTINMTVDNGRIKRAGYVSIYLCEQDLIVLNDIYEWDECICSEVLVSKKDYLPRWFTDYVYQRYVDKCQMKPVKDKDPVGYALAKARVNLLFGLSVQKPLRENYIEVTEPGKYKVNREGLTDWFESGEYRIDFDKDPRTEYDKYINNNNTILGYFIGCYITAYAFRNLFRLGSCVRRYYKEDGTLAYPPHWYYSDTDSCYSDDWDMDKINEYNEECKRLLLANGYGPVKVGKKEYWLGVAEIDPSDSVYTEFTVLGAKRYAGRAASDNKLHITVAGVPKKGAECLKDDLTNFCSSFIFDGETTGKLMHTYIYSDKGIYKDAFGNEIGDSIDLSPCDYELDAVDKEEYLETEDFQFDYYGEENFDIYDR